MPVRLQSLRCADADAILRRGRVLLVHSLGLNAACYVPLCEQLPYGWQVDGYDQRGHGNRSNEGGFGLDALVDDAIDAVSQLAPATVHLMGHSMGGVIAALAAARAGSRVASLTLIATPSAGSAAFEERAATAEREGMEAAIEATLARWLDGEHDTLQVRRARASARSALQAMSMADFSAAWRALASFGDFAFADRSLPPLLCIAARGDASTPPEVMQRIVAQRLQAQPAGPARLSVVPGAGHLLPLTRPSPVAALLADHWTATLPDPSQFNEHRETP
ncbi:alpha/beta fold hydrolase [Variovorax sp. Sphag1AA]|uniref:alpha/beta fold hydrolase n=1 Tax=Variovorax sp. Sphag1AA TaxID=2587027 RepID=UPI00161E72B6|nr:alpha/beta fold hydrolase [Variovorax sp. Sphag1AA]MBB3177975.1 3-oxoadipate enol-lactonase [Variovorax sp. Sphag1AA]